jgi:hypothetical protein
MRGTDFLYQITQLGTPFFHGVRFEHFTFNSRAAGPAAYFDSELTESWITRHLAEILKRRLGSCEGL